MSNYEFATSRYDKMVYRRLGDRRLGDKMFARQALGRHDWATRRLGDILGDKYIGYTLWFKKNVPTLADYNYDPAQSILIIFSKLFVNDHESCLVVKFSTSPHMCCHYTL